MARTTKQCSICGASHQRGKDFCWDCARQRAEAKSALIWQATRIKKTLLAERGNLCQRCSTKAATIVHHITGLADGGTNDQDNLLLVCQDCHGKIHGWNQR